MKNNSEIWFSDSQTDSVCLNIRVTNQLYHGISEFQEIDVFQSESFGKFLVLDGEVIFSEADEFIYNEMVVHVPMAVHPNVRKVLIIGGGDGGVAREFTAYPEIEQIDVVEPDEQMVEVCKKFFPDCTKGLDDERVQVSYQDGLRFVRSRENEYDIIINDSTDPFGHTEGLFTKEFYGSCYRALKEDGIMVYQHGSPFFDEEESTFRSMHRKVFRTFPISRVYQAHVPTCSSGYWTFGFASRKYHPIVDFNPERWDSRGIKTWYYTSQLHKAAFMLPRYVVDILHEEEKI
ncbi:MAG: polyamine aminopropyltransferase [Lachnospiraceae bacterium]|nr:polyamine aminopropyltransferase [Lachnospiraceae bacterium]MCR5390597.1 polyamine aminopropyltransferase [Lachnospiraceae bacterium]